MQTTEELTKLLDEEDEFRLGFKFPPEHRESYEDGSVNKDNYEKRLFIHDNSEKYLSD